jgi:F-type H+-transporting ATPase subunit epsilon
MNHFTVDILTPEKVIARNIPGESLLIPTIRGQINVLPEHTHVVTRLSTGIVSVFAGGDDQDREFSVTHGICKVLDNKVTVLAHTSEESRNIDVDRAKRALENANSMMSSDKHLTEEEMVKYQRKAERAELRIQLSSK